MNSENSQSNDFFYMPESKGLDSIDDFIKELEAKERDLHISQADTIVEIEESDIETDDEIAALEELVKSYETAQPVKFAPSAQIEMPSQVFESAANGNFGQLQQEVEKLRSELARLTGERSEMVETFRRRQNDFDNIKKRIEREGEENRENALTDFAVLIFPVIDNLSRALDSAANLKGEKSADFSQFVQGIELVKQQLNDVLVEMEVFPIPAIGKPFDPHLHEAVAAEPNDAYLPNTVIEEILKGYKFKNKVIRHSVVKVSSSETLSRVSPAENNNDLEMLDF